MKKINKTLNAAKVTRRSVLKGAAATGAAAAIGENSVEVAATLKVARTIWIVPLVIFAAWLYRSKNE